MRNSRQRFSTPVPVPREEKMAAVVDATKEAAFEAFKAEFVRNGFRVPEGLIYLLSAFTLRPDEVPDTALTKLYKNLWCKLWYGSGQTLGASVGFQPTYVFPPTLKRVVREIIPGCLVDSPDPTHSRVYQVNIGDLANAKWPAAKPSKSQQAKKKLK